MLFRSSKRCLDIAGHLGTDLIVLWLAREGTYIREAKDGRRSIALLVEATGVMEREAKAKRGEKEKGKGLLSNEVDSWMTGINQNVDGKQVRIIARYSGSAPDFRARADAVAAEAYRELSLA